MLNNCKAKQKTLLPSQIKRLGQYCYSLPVFTRNSTLAEMVVSHLACPCLFLFFIFRLQIIQTLCPEWVQWSDLISAGNREWLVTSIHPTNNDGNWAEKLDISNGSGIKSPDNYWRRDKHFLISVTLTAKHNWSKTKTKWIIGYLFFIIKGLILRNVSLKAPTISDVLSEEADEE